MHGMATGVRGEVMAPKARVFSSFPVAVPAAVVVEVWIKSMPKIIFVQPDGSQQTVQAEVGQSVMEAATANLVRGIVADCGGGCSCATCHVYVDPGWSARLQPADDIEQAMLEGAIEPDERSRLSCQLRMTEALDGLVLHVPAAQF